MTVSSFILLVQGEKIVTRSESNNKGVVIYCYCQVLIAEKMNLKNEMYFALLLDRASAGPIAIACSRGGTSIEDLAEQFPNLIIREPIDSKLGMTKSQATSIAEKLELKYCKVDDAAEQIMQLYKLFIQKDCTMLEINPLAESADGVLIAADAKLNFDDNASFRQKGVYQCSKMMALQFALSVDFAILDFCRTFQR